MRWYVLDRLSCMSAWDERAAHPCLSFSSRRPVGDVGRLWRSIAGPADRTLASRGRAGRCGTTSGCRTPRTPPASKPSGFDQRRTLMGGFRAYSFGADVSWQQWRWPEGPWGSLLPEPPPPSRILTNSHTHTHTNPRRNWIGYDADKERPLKDPEHPFNTVYSAAFRLVCSGERGRLLNTQS